MVERQPLDRARFRLKVISEFYGEPLMGELRYHLNEVSSRRTGLPSDGDDLIQQTHITILKRSAIALVAAVLSLVLILFLHPSRSQQPAEPPKPHKTIINWEKVPHAVSYNVYRRPYRIETFTKVGSVSNSSYEDSAVQGGERYCYVVTSIDSKGKESARSREICQTVPLP